MLVLKNVSKIYTRKQSQEDVVALNNVSLDLPDKGFVAILGASGSGKTTLLNIIGGLDKATSGNMIVDGLSTSEFTVKDWDSYRNQKIGFVLQNCYLLPHLNVRDNVAVKLQISHSKAKDIDVLVDEALRRVDLLDKKLDKPKALSGGQKQRVAIARALVGNPTVILADEPTGALDSKTGTSIMELLKEASKDHLVVMVTHNNEYASKYADRVIELKDGQIVNDSKPIKNEVVTNPKQLEKVSIPGKTTLKWGLKNLIVKKFSTISIVVAAALGLTGVSLILSVSSSVQHVFDKVQAESFSKYPVSFSSYTNTDPQWDASKYPPYSDEEIVIADYSSYNKLYHYDYMSEAFLNYMRSMPSDYYLGNFERSTTYFHLFTKRNDTTYAEVPASYYYFYKGVKDIDFIDRQYDCLKGNFPKEANELALVVDDRNRVNVSYLYSLGFDVNTSVVSDVTFSFDDVLNKTFKYIPTQSSTNPDISYYVKNDSNNTYHMTYKNAQQLYEGSDFELKITGILRQKEEYDRVALRQGIIYTPAFEEKVLSDANSSNIVIDQKKAGEAPVIRIDSGDLEPSGYTKINVSEAINKINNLDLSSADVYYPTIFVDNGAKFEINGTVVKKGEWDNKHGVGEVWLYDSPITDEEEREQIDSTCLQVIRMDNERLFSLIIENETKLNVVSSLSAHVKVSGSDKTIDSYKAGDIRNVLDGRGFRDTATRSQVYYYEASLHELGSLEQVTELNYYTIDYNSRVRIKDYFKKYFFDYSTEPTGVSAYDYLENASVQFDGALSLMTSVLYVFAIISVLVSAILNAILTFISVRQRTNEIGLLRSLGARRKDIAIMVETESLFCGLFGGLLSILVTLIIISPVNAIITNAIYKYKFYLISTVKFDLEGYQWWVAPICIGLGILTAAISALISSILASRKDPAKAINE